MKHITKTGERIELTDIEDNHLINILKRIERMAEEWMIVQYGWGGWDIDNMWSYEETLYWDDVLEHMNYTEYKEELRRRNLSSNN